jgi:hypothetical protein
MKKFILTICLSFLFTGITTSSGIDFSKIKNWSVADSISEYDPSNLWEYINGAADLFIAYGFQNLQSCELSSGEIEIVVDVYNMGTQLNAFGMYKTERGDPTEKLGIGTEAVITSPNQCLMLKDIYYIKINVYEGQLTEEKSNSLLNSISEILAGSNTFPGEFELLPQKNKIKNSEHFVKEGYLGLSELTNCLYAEYKTDAETSFQYFIIITENKNSHDDIWKKFTKKWKYIENKEFPILFRKIPYKGLVGILKTENGIIGVTNSNTESELKDRLQKFYKK